MTNFNTPYLLLFLLATIGLTNILVHGRILDVIPVRPWLRNILGPNWFELFECYECMGFWCGLICGFALISTNIFVCLACGFAGSVAAMCYNDVMYLIRSKVEFEVNDESDE